MFDKLLLILLGVFLMLTGIFATTNIEVVWSRPICGFSALAAGIICLIRAVK